MEQGAQRILPRDYRTTDKSRMRAKGGDSPLALGWRPLGVSFCCPILAPRSVMCPNHEVRGRGKRCLAFAQTCTKHFSIADHTIRVRAGRFTSADLSVGAPDRLIISTTGLSAVGPGAGGTSPASTGSLTSGKVGSSGAAASSISKDTPFVLGLDCAREPESAGNSDSAADLFLPRGRRPVTPSAPSMANTISTDCS